MSRQMYLFLHKYIWLAMKSENVLAEMEHSNNIIGNVAFMLIGNCLILDILKLNLLKAIVKRRKFCYAP